jgi:toxin HigB-1
MDVEFVDPDLARVDTEPGFNAGFGIAVVRAYRKVLRFIRSAVDERDFRSMRSLNFEKLKGDRSHQHSFRLNQQWRLIVEIRKCERKNKIAVISIEDYH